MYVNYICNSWVFLLYASVCREIAFLHFFICMYVICTIMFVCMYICVFICIQLYMICLYRFVWVSQCICMFTYSMANLHHLKAMDVISHLRIAVKGEHRIYADITKWWTELWSHDILCLVDRGAEFRASSRPRKDKVIRW